MVSTGYSEAFVEVLAILDNTPIEEKNSIPEKFMNFLKENASKTYKIAFDKNKQIEELTLKKETKAMLIWYFLGHVNRMNIKREMKKPVQASVQVVSGSFSGRRIRQPQEESLLSVIYTKTTESICKPD